MAPRPFWKGYLKLSLVTCPVSMTPAISDREKVRFHTINKKTGNRVQSRYVDAETGKPVADEQEARGYETADGQFVILEEDELDAVALESTRTIDIDMFVPRDSIGWIWYDRPHYLAPEDKVGEEAFSVIRDAMETTGTVGIARLVLYRRERAVMLEPRGKGIVVWTLRYGDEVRPADAYFKDVEADKPDAKALKMVKALIEKKTESWDPKLVQDPVQARLRALIASKQKKGGRKAAPKKPEAPQPPEGNVVSIMDALRKSLDSEKRKSR